MTGYPWQTGDELLAADLNAAIATAIGGSGPPTGTAGGDLSGSYPNPVVARITGFVIAPSATIDTTNAINITSGALNVARLPVVSTVTPGAYTNTNITVDQYGRVTLAASGTGGGAGGITDAPSDSTPYARLNAAWVHSAPVFSPGAPAAAFSGQLWWNTNLVGLYIWNGSTWVSTGGGSGTVTSVVASTGLSGGTITTTGTIAVTAATTAALGGVIVGSGLAVSAGTLSTSGGGGTVSSIVAGTGLSGGTISSSGTIAVIAATTAALGGVVVGTGMTVSSGTISATPAFSAVTGTATYAQLPTEVQQLPISFPFAGTIAASAAVNIPMPMSITVPSSLTGTVVYDGTQATASAAFILNKISGGTTVAAIGTVTVTTASHTSATLAGSGGTLAIGDVLQIVAPGTADATLANLGITILASRV